MGRISRRDFVRGTVAAASLGTGLLGRLGQARAQSPLGNPLDTFQYVVVLMLENRSFDNILGYLYQPGESRGPFAGVAGQDLCNPIPAGAPAPPGVTSVCVTPNTGQQTGDYNKPYPDPGEEYPHVNTQLYNVVAPPYNLPSTLPLQAPMTGFVTDYINNYPPHLAAPPSYDQYRIIMECFAREAVPVLSTLAREFAVFDHWFCSVPSQTLCNRAFWHAGTSGGHVINPAISFSGFEQWLQWWEDNAGPTLFNAISAASPDKGLDWRIYSSNLVSFTRLTHEVPLAPYGSEYFPSLEQFFTDCASGQLETYSSWNLFSSPRTTTSIPPATIPPSGGPSTPERFSSERC
jgi:phospholipase C